MSREGEFMGSFSQDLARYFVLQYDSPNPPALSRLKTILLTQGIWATGVYRFRRWCLTERDKWIFPLKEISKLSLVLEKLVEVATGISLSPSAKIGPGFYVGHFGGIIVGPGVEVGENCNISQGVTLGEGGRGEERGSPKIGNRVYIAPGAKVFGKINIGDDVAIGANAVVNLDIPDKGVAVGVPAKVAGFGGSSDFIKFDENA